MRTAAPLFATLRRRIFAILALAIIFFAGGTYYFAAWYFRRVFSAAEEEEARCHLSRYRGAIAERLRDLQRQLEQPEARQRLLRLLALSAEDFRAAQKRLALPAPRQRWLAIIDDKGEIRACRGYDAETDSLLPAPVGLGEHFASASQLWQRLKNAGKVAGILLLADDPPLLIAAAAVEREDKTAALVTAQALSLQEISRLCQSGYISANLRRWNAVTPDEVRRLPPSAAAGDNISTIAGDNETSAFCLLHDIYGMPALQLEILLPRIIYSQAWLGIEYATLLLLLTGVVLGFLFLLFFDLSVLSRLSRARKAVAAIKSGELAPDAFRLSGRDELARLANTVADMAHSLQEYQAGLRRARDLLEQKVAQRSRELAETHDRLRCEMEERQRLQAAMQRADKMRELAAVAASIGQAIEEPLSSLRVDLTALENLWHSAAAPEREATFALLKSLTTHSQRLAAVLDQARCLIRGREMQKQWRTDLAPCLEEALAIFSASYPNAPRPDIACEAQLPPLAVPAVPLQQMLVYLFETLAASTSSAWPDTITITVRRETANVLVRLVQTPSQLRRAAQKPWRLVLAEALAFSWNANYRLEETADTMVIELHLPVAEEV